jgi:hypothetical protein
MSRAQREKSQSRALAAGKQSAAWLGVDKRDSDRNTERRRRRGLYGRLRTLDRNMEFFE